MNDYNETADLLNQLKGLCTEGAFKFELFKWRYALYLDEEKLFLFIFPGTKYFLVNEDKNLTRSTYDAIANTIRK